MTEVIAVDTGEGQIVIEELVHETVTVSVDQHTAIEVETDSTLVISQQDTEAVSTASETLLVITKAEQGPPGSGGAGGAPVDYTTLSDVVSDTLVYRGYALPGAAPEDSVWKIERISLVDDNSNSLWAGGGAMAYSWLDRLTLEYA